MSTIRFAITAALLANVIVISSGCNGTPVANCTPSLDICNGLDDDCDGLVDEGFGVGGACTVGQGACARSGHLVCAADGASARCDVLPGVSSVEICNGIDDDCDGLVDELLPGCCTPGDERPCGAAVDVGICRAGKETCTAQFGWSGECLDADGVPVIFVGSRPERCNGLDDDCDGDVDEGFNVGQGCTAGAGACFAAGSMVCTADGAGTVCSVTAGTPALEVCDGIDDNCDGRVDEEGAVGCTPYWLDADGDGYGVGTSRCLCATSGGYVATQGGDCDDTKPGVHPGAPELCDGIDDNCDGQIDEGFDVGSTVWCSVGVGACTRWGTPVCSADGMATVCTAVAGTPTAEVCNGADDDCDGVADEGTVAELCGTVPANMNAQPDVVSCVSGRCVLACDAGWYDEDAKPSTGCECQPDADDLAERTSVCTTPIDLGTLWPGKVIVVTGTIVPQTDEDWYHFSADPSAVGTYAWPSGGGYGWWVGVRFDPAYPTGAGMTFIGSGADPVPPCDSGSNSTGGGGYCNNPNNQVRHYYLHVNRPWTSPMPCTPSAGTTTSFYRIQIKGYSTEPNWSAPW